MPEELVPTTNQSLIRSLDDLMKVAQVLMRSGLLPNTIKTAEAAAVIILKGRELGVPMMESFALINVISGKPTTSPQLMLGLIQRAKGDLEDMTITDDGEKCTVTMKRRGMSPHSESFSMADARLMVTFEGYGENRKQVALSDKYNWRQMPKIMRKWRAVAACARVVFPDLIGGLYLNEEMGANVDEAGFIVEAEDDLPTYGSTTDEMHESPPAPPAPNTVTVSKSLPKVISVDYNEGALNYRDEDGVKKINVNGTWKTAADFVGQISPASRDRVAGLFTNEFEMVNHLKKHFNKASISGLTWEELAALLAWKRDKHPDERWYADKVLTPADNPQMDELRRVYSDGAPNEFLNVVRDLKNDHCLVELLTTRGWTWKDDRENLINLAVLLRDGTLEFGTEEFWDLVKHAKPEPL